MISSLSMQAALDAFLHHDIRAFVESIGYIGVYTVIFAESGLLVGFFLPGDSLIFTAGLLSSPLIGLFDIWPMLIGSWIAAVVGDNVGYEFGKRVGRKLFRREDSMFFHKDNLIRAQEFYDKHGGKAIVLARFMPVVRTFAPIVAGIGHMDHKRFTFFNFIGGTVWVWGLGLMGYFLGVAFPDADKYLMPIIFLIIFLSVAPPIWHIYKEDKEKWHSRVSHRVNAVKYWFKSWF